MPTFLNGMGRGAHPCTFKRARAKALAAADLVLVFGTPLDFRLGYGEKIPPEARLVQVDLDGAEIGRNRGVDVGIVGDTGTVLVQLAQRTKAEALSWKPWMHQVIVWENEAIERTRAEAESDAEPINPLRVCAELNAFLDDKTIVVGDGGDFVATAANILNVEGPGNWMDPGPLGTLGVGPGYAMAAKLARPDHTVVLVLGDGSFGFHGMEFEAMVRQGIKVVGIVGNDAAWTQILRGQAMIYGEDRTPATRLSHARYDLVVSALGGHGEYVERVADLRPALARAFAADRASLVNVKIGASDFRKYAISV
jgi:acetolactate synthase-1/2/3 large subunit